MKQCWPEGTLRAYLDGELPPDEMRSVEAHLDQCPECERLHAEMSVRASFVTGLMDTLATPVAQPAARRATARATGSWAWTGAAVALAAGLAIAAMLIPKRDAPKEVALTPVESRQVVTQAPLPPPESVSIPVAAARRVSIPVRKPRLTARMEPFIALDDEPIESGIVMRVELPGSTPADIVFSPDGRARAVRLVNGTQRNH